ncbi:hypothetical protein EJ08DRAFT_701544 [Tothia fuscella]|uniref:Mitotic-spindle organizing protein 1 n=1 Tax=Tothia fuscella TaxID=1048955 RepID=A0A9P4NHX5_9PEZI|nr:hypothetical protein EJ08DRAFT_701544 [Tothia fuscella]
MSSTRQEARDNKRQPYLEVLEILGEMATLLDINITQRQLAYCVSLIENGVEPQALANVINGLRARYPEEEEVPKEHGKDESTK